MHWLGIGLSLGFALSSSISTTVKKAAVPRVPAVFGGGRVRSAGSPEPPRLTRCGSPRSWLTSAALACRWWPSTSGALALVERNSQDLWIGVLYGLLVIS
jgi:hypothetical protein